MNRVMIKSLAKERIRGKILTFAMALLAFALLTAGCGKVFGSRGFLSGGASTLVSLFILNVALYGITFMSLKTARGGEIEFSDLLVGCSNYWRVVLLYFFTSLFVTLWSLLLIIPGIIAGISYSFAPYILMDNPEMEPLDAIKLSKKMTDGYKAELFTVWLSFIGWFFVGMITFGIAMFWVYPYISTTYALYYDALKQNYSETIEGEVIE